MADLTTEHDPKPARSLASIVREKTNDGLLILDFLNQAFRGELKDFDTTHRLDAANQLMVMTIGIAVLRRSPPDSAFAIALCNDTSLFTDVVRFQIDVIEGRHEDVTVQQRVVLAEQLRSRLTLARSRDVAPTGAVGANFYRILRSKTRGGSRINRFLSDVASGRLHDATPDDVRNARKLLES